MSGEDDISSAVEEINNFLAWEWCSAHGVLRAGFVLPVSRDAGWLHPCNICPLFYFSCDQLGCSVNVEPIYTLAGFELSVIREVEKV